MKKQRPFHPILFAVFPVLSLFAINLDYVSAADLVRPLVVLALIAGIMWFITARVTKDAMKSAVAVSFFLIVTFAIGYFKEPIEQGLGHNVFILVSVPLAVVSGLFISKKLKDNKNRTVFTVGIILLLTLLLSAVLIKSPIPDRHMLRLGWLILPTIAALAGLRIKSAIEPVTALLNFISIILVVQPLVSYGISVTIKEKTLVAQELSQRSNIEATDKPDIYYFVLDGFGREDVLEQTYGITENLLVDGLKERGFYIADKSTSNYTQTLLSVGSSLNMDYVQSLTELDPEDRTRETLKKLTNSNKVSNLLKSIGYEYISIVTRKEFLPTESADKTLEDSHGRSQLEDAVINKTPFGGTPLFSGNHRERVLAVYENLDSQIATGKPRFVLVHVISPHPPFVFNADGTVKGKSSDLSDGSHFFDHGGTIEQYISGYKDQADYIAMRTLDSIDLILENSEKTPLIIVQGDHGPKSGLDYESIEKTDFTEALPILNAYLVPEQIEEELYPEISPVNSFRLIFNGLFKTEHELLEDKSYYSKWSFPYDFVDVTLED